MQNKILSYIHNPDLVDDEGIEYLKYIICKYPYFQAARVILAKIFHAKNDMTAAQYIKTASLYVTEINYYKMILENTFTLCKKNYFPHNDSNDTLANNVIDNSYSDNDFKWHGLDYDISSNNIVPNKAMVAFSSSDSIIEIIIPKTLSQSDQDLSNAQITLESTINSKATDVLYYEEKVDFDLSQDVNNIPLSTKPCVVKYIDQIAKKEELKLIHYYDQQLLIKDFIKKQIKFSPMDPAEALNEISNVDLTKENNIIIDDFMTENLAKIMLKQGKHELALDIYEKLIVKFPQKIDYIASLMDKLNIKK